MLVFMYDVYFLAVSGGNAVAPMGATSITGPGKLHTHYPETRTRIQLHCAFPEIRVLSA
jgi:hypothetical protein